MREKLKALAASQVKTVVNKVLGRSDIIDNDSVYMKRWRFVHTPWFGVRLHNIVRSDKDRELHDHPFTFVSVILAGGYVEETVDGRKVSYRPGQVLVRSADVLHRLDLNRDQVTGREIPAWTFVIRGPKVRQWGFLTHLGWVPAFAFHKYQEARGHRAMREATA